MTGDDTFHSGSVEARPVVASAVSNRGPWLFAGVLAVIALGLFGTLEARRAAVTSPSVTVPSSSQAGVIASPPELVIPGEFSEAEQPLSAPIGYARPTLGAPPSIARERQPPRPYNSYAQPQSSYSGLIAGQNALPPQAPSYVYQASTPKAESGGSEGEKSAAVRVAATRLTNPATTVPQGAVVQAVLETALDSNRPGFARAVVTRDVFSFDGGRVLIPRGSKLFGEYKADLAQGQNRALIQWHRLTRPDGVIIDLDSPSADPLGRAGVKGKVNSHFFARFGGAILQSVLDVGVQLAARKATGDTVIVGLPGSTPQVTVTKPDEVRPTLTVKEGTSVSVFVVHDLDFTEVER